MFNLKAKIRHAILWRWRNFWFNEFNEPESPYGMFRNFVESSCGYSIEIYSDRLVPNQGKFKLIASWTKYFSPDLIHWDGENGESLPSGAVDCLVSSLKYHGVWDRRWQC